MIKVNAPKLRSVVRLDSIPLTKAYFTPEGFLMDKPVVTSTGIFEYTNHDGSIRRELRLPEDVFSPESLKSFKAKPIIITHDAGLVDKDNVMDNAVGTILSEGERSGENDVVAEIVIYDTDAMKSCGFKELSLGYNLDLDETPGEWNGQRYDAVQKNIRINHLALVKEARAGDQARLNLDGRDKNALKGGKTMGARNTKLRKAHRGDAVLSQEEFEKAIDEYKQRKAQRGDEDVAEKEIVEEEPNKEVMTKVQAVKDRRDRRDEEGDPKDEEEALTTIAHQDEDIDILFDIIDTLLAKQDFNAAKTDAEDEEMEEEELVEDGCDPVGGVDKVNKLHKNTAADAEDEELMEEEDEELVEDAEDEELEEEFEEDADEEEMEDFEEDEEDEEMMEEEEEFEEDAEDEEMEEEEEMTLNTDSVDRMVSRSVRNHIALGNLGRKVGINGLEMKSEKYAKKKIIKAVCPNMHLDGKSDKYINAAFDMARKEIKSKSKKDTSYQKKQMFNKDSAERVSKNSAVGARERMIRRQMNK